MRGVAYTLLSVALMFGALTSASAAIKTIVARATATATVTATIVPFIVSPPIPKRRPTMRARAATPCTTSADRKFP
jgi:hypothetical protein